MSEILAKFSLRAAKFHGQVWMCLVAIWLIVVCCMIASINSQPFSGRQRKFWILTVCLLPIAGALAYLPFSCRWDEVWQLFFFRRHHKDVEDQKARPKSKELPGGEAL
ncbi:MAG: PLDc N-terminal domain-containing protein [Chthoniobacter sp.]|nr:PLDc N-terminal domain-containing protein [Chthoniobacter sp.]